MCSSDLRPNRGDLLRRGGGRNRIGADVWQASSLHSLEVQVVVVRRSLTSQLFFKNKSKKSKENSSCKAVGICSAIIYASLIAFSAASLLFCCALSFAILLLSSFFFSSSLWSIFSSREDAISAEISSRSFFFASASALASAAACLLCLLLYSYFHLPYLSSFL